MGRVGAIALLLALSACAPTTVKLVCPPIVEYSAEDQARAADELEVMPAGSIIRERFMPDYGKLRAQIRACAKSRMYGLNPVVGIPTSEQYQ